MELSGRPAKRPKIGPSVTSVASTAQSPERVSERGDRQPAGHLPDNKQKAKTHHEKSRGRELDDDTKGTDAEHRCGPCQDKHDKWSNRKCKGAAPTLCRVALDPKKFDSYKCGNCISGKVKCTFSAAHPGASYSTEIQEAGRQREESKQAGRDKARATNRKKAESAAKGEGHSSPQPSSLPSPPLTDESEKKQDNAPAPAAPES
ncbi:hypothetical protein F5Y19DRAFT_448526 [Xylariaceae sp. FL1651]|nr:hypothetical protein F5Y19DRAFT_448526 [Xylariaceae sp. FL1651]